MIDNTNISIFDNIVKIVSEDSEVSLKQEELKRFVELHVLLHGVVRDDKLTIKDESDPNKKLTISWKTLCSFLAQLKQKEEMDRISNLKDQELLVWWHNIVFHSK